MVVPAVSSPAQPAPFSYETMGRPSQPAVQPADGRPAGAESVPGVGPEKPPEVAKAEVQPEAAPGKPEEEKPPPWHTDPRFKDDLDLIKQKESIRAILEKVATPEDAQHLVESVQELQEVVGHFDTLRNGLANDPIGVAEWWKKSQPEAFDRVLDAFRPGMVADLMDAARAQGDEAAYAFLERVAKGVAQPSTPAKPDDALRRREEGVAAREREIGQQQYDGFHGRVQEKVGGKLRETFKTITEKAVFPSDTVKDEVFEKALSFVKETVDADTVFDSRMRQLIRGDYGDQHLGSVAKAAIQRAMANGLWERSVAKALAHFAITEQAIAKVAAAKTTEQAAAEARKEPGAGGGPANPSAPAGTTRDRMKEAFNKGEDPYTSKRTWGIAR